jgi:hypothetical protein
MGRGIEPLVARPADDIFVKGSAPGLADAGKMRHERDRYAVLF